jgi:hypothetical protein
MTTETLTAHKSSRFGLVAGVPLGAGRDDHLVVGPVGDDSNRAAIGFPQPTWPARGELVSATLRVRTSTQVHATAGSRRHWLIRRATGTWIGSEGDVDDDDWSPDPTTWPGPSSTAVGQVATTIPSANNTDHLVDVTALVLAMAPRNRIAGAGGAAWLGFVLYAEDEADPDDAQEVYSAHASSARIPTLEVEVDEVAGPYAPTLLQPIGLDGWPTFLAEYDHPFGLEVDAYDLDVALWVNGGPDSFWQWHRVAETTGINTATNEIDAQPPTGSIINLGSEYGWRMRVRDTDGTYGSWSAWATFIRSGVIGSPPDPYDRWAHAILASLAAPPALSALGTLRPDGPDEVIPVVAAEYGDRWQLVHDHVDPPIDRTVRVLGMRVKLTGGDAGGVEVDATTEDV